MARIVLNGEEQVRYRVIELMFKKIGHANRGKGRPDTFAGAQAQRCLDLLDREIVLTGPDSDSAALDPTASVARIERQGPGRSAQSLHRYFRRTSPARMPHCQGCADRSPPPEAPGGR